METTQRIGESEVKVYQISDILSNNEPYDIEKIDNFIEENDAYYYCAEKRNFFISIGIQRAKEHGKKVLVAENLS